MAKNDAAKKQEEQLPVAQVQGGELAVPTGAWEEPTPMSLKEILIPKFLMMQGQSKLVSEGKCKMGDIVNSVTGQVFGSPEKPVEFIPIMKLPSIWVINDIVYDPRTGKGTRQYRETISVTPKNENDEWTEKDEKDRVILERDYTIQFLVMLPEDINGFPYVMALRRTSIRAGKKIGNHFQLCAKDKVAPAKYVLKFSDKKEMKDQQPYFVADLLADKREATPKELQIAYNWFVTFQKNKDMFKVDDSDEREGEGKEAGGPAVDATGTDTKAQF